MPKLPKFSTLVMINPEKEYDISYEIVDSYFIDDIEIIPNQRIEKGLDIDIPTFEIDTENRILSLWEICSKIPMTMDLRNKLLLSNDISYRFNLLENYLDEIKERTA